jgi:S-adenosylmethionine decarboxylase
MTGIEWIVDAYGCSPDRLRDLATLQALFARLVADLDLHPCGDARWHQFGDSGGITGLSLLSESHLACHSFPEFGTLCLNLFCCRPRGDWDFADQLRQAVGARHVHVRRLERPYCEPPASLFPDVTLQGSARDV